MADNVQPIETENTDKEKFETGMTDTELVAQIDSWLNESQDFYSLLKEVWEQNLNYYHGNQTGLENIRGKESRAVENRIWMATETMIPIASSRLPDIEVRSGSEDEQDQIDADDLKDILAYHKERTGFQTDAEKFLRNLILLRYGVFKKFWDKEKDDVGRQVIDPRRIRIPKYGRNIDELAFIIEYLELSYPQLVLNFGKDKADEIVKVKPKETEDNVKKRKSTYNVLEVWTNEFVAWRAGSVILDKKKNLFYDFKDKKNNFFDNPRKPYIIKSAFETDESIIGDTDYVQATISIQDNINIRKRQAENIINKVANPDLLIDSDAMSEEQAANITNEAGQIIYGKDATKAVTFISPGNVPAYLFTDLETSRAQFDNIWGVHSTTRGEREGKETLGGRQLLRAADLGRIDLVARQIERASDEDSEWDTQMMKMFYTEERAFSILGEDGTRFIKKFSRGKIKKGVKPQVVAGSTLPKDEITQRQEAIQMWQLGALGIRTLYKRLKLANIPDAIQDFIETKSGRILQEQGGGGGLMSPAETPSLPPAIEPQV